MININLKQQTILIICISFATLMLVTLGYALWQWQSDWQVAHQEIAPKKIAASSDENAMIIASIPEAHLFGEALAKLGEVPLSNLQLRVTGIVQAGQQSGMLSKAYISIAGQPSKIYELGD